MSYEKGHINWWTFTTTAADVLTATGDAAETFRAPMKVHINRVGFIISTLTAIDTIAAILSFDKRVTVGSDTGRLAPGDTGGLTGGTITFTDAAPAGEVFWKDITPHAMDPGEEIVPEVTTAGTDSGSAAGAGYPVIFYDPIPEEAGNLTDITVSA